MKLTAVVVVVTSTTGAATAMMTVSSTPPISSVASTLSVVLRVIRRSARTMVWNPGRENVTAYSPVGRAVQIVAGEGPFERFGDSCEVALEVVEAIAGAPQGGGLPRRVSRGRRNRGRARFAAVAIADAEPRAWRAPDEPGGRLPDGQATRQGGRARGRGQLRSGPPASRRICSMAARSNARRRSWAMRARVPRNSTTGRPTTSPSRTSSESGSDQGVRDSEVGRLRASWPAVVRAGAGADCPDAMRCFSASV